MNARDMLKNSVILSYTIRTWGNRRKAKEVKKALGKTNITATKKLVVSPEYQLIVNGDAEFRKWVGLRSVPSFLKGALQLVDQNNISIFEKAFEDRMAERIIQVDQLRQVYPMRKLEAKEQDEAEYQKAISENRVAIRLYNEADYPLQSEIPGLFDMRYNWWELNVPEVLPDDVRDKEIKKLEQFWSDAISEIILSLRLGFQETLDHAIDRLKVIPGEKPKRFEDTFIPKFNEFVETFPLRNIVNDSQLEELINRAKDLVQGISNQDLRDDMKLRDYTVMKFGEIKRELDDAIVQASRKFDFSDVV